MKFRTKALFSSVSIIFFVAIFHLLCASNTLWAAGPSGVLKEAIHWNISADSLDPAYGYISVGAHLPLYLYHDALVKNMPDGIYSPSLAESWTVSPDAKVYEFKLRKGVKFHNGDPLTAEDVVFTFKRYKGSNAKMILGRLEKIEAVDPYLVRIRFKDPFADFLDFLIPGGSTIGWIVPKKYIEKVGEAEYRKKPIGAGPYKFVEFVPGVRFVGEAFEGYWRKVPHIKRMEFYSVPEPATRLAMVKRGEVDIATLMQGVFYENVKKDPKLRMLAPLSPTRYIAYPAAQWDPKSPWSDQRVRLAASLAIDRQTLADVHMPGCGGIGTIAMEGDPMGLDLPPRPYDPARAKKLLAEAGYPNGFQGGKYYPHEGGYWPYGEQIANYWKAVGINMETILLDRPALVAMRNAKKMTGATFIDLTASPTIGGRLSFLFGPGAYGTYPDIQALWEKYNKAVDPKLRKDLITKVQQLVYDKVMWISLTNTNSPAAIGPRVKGNPYKIQPMIWFTAPLEDIELNP
jgi:peptide/nickel transport system substrate-binding protein